MIGIYRIENLVNHKCYIGKSKDIKERWTMHRWELNNNSHCNKHLQSAWNLYGSENFEFSVLEECDLDSLSEKEISYIAKYNSFSSGYNLTTGGEGGTGHSLSEEMKQWIGSFHKNQIISEERKRDASIRFSGMGNPFYGKTHTPETRKKISKHHILTGSSKGANNGRAKRVICDGVIYGCAGDCGDFYGIKSCTIRSWLRGNRPMPRKFKDLGLSFI